MERIILILSKEYTQSIVDWHFYNSDYCYIYEVTISESILLKT